MEKKPTIREVAKLAGVGLMTVSRVINEHPSVRPSTRRRVQTAIVHLGYRQNEAARLLKGKRARIIGLIVPELSDAFFAACAQTVQQVARAHGYMTLIAASERDAELELQQAEVMANDRVSGLLIVTSAKDGDERLQKLQENGLQIVALDRPLPGERTDCVLMENHRGAELAVQHLIDHGHRKIAGVGYDRDIYTIRERIRGYESRMRSAGLRPSVTLKIGLPDEARQFVEQYMMGKKRSTAIFSMNHRTSVSLLKALAEKNLRVPEDVAMVGFDDFDAASLMSPPLTTIAQSPVELAHRATSLLISSVKAGGRGANQSAAKILISPKLMIRSSCGPHKIESAYKRSI